MRWLVLKYDIPVFITLLYIYQDQAYTNKVKKYTNTAVEINKKNKKL